MRRCDQAILVILAIGAMSTLTACSADDQVPTGELADHVATTIEQRVGVRVDVDCGEDLVTAAGGTTVQCEVTDPEIGATYPASVEIVKTDGQGGYGLDLSVDPAEQMKQHDEGIDS